MFSFKTIIRLNDFISVGSRVSLSSLNNCFNNKVDTTYPVIPKVRFLLPSLDKLPHHKWRDMLNYNESWLQLIADRSLDRSTVRSVIESPLGRGLIEAGTLYVAFPLAGHNDYELIYDMAKGVASLTFIDGFLSQNINPETDQQICDYITESIDEKWNHDPEKDPQRPFLLNAYGQSVLVWRRCLTRDQQIRMIQAFSDYVTMMLAGKGKQIKSQVEKMTLENYLVERAKDGCNNSVTILKERLVHVKMASELVNDPDIVDITVIGDGMIVLNNDLATYFREKVINDFDLRFNYISLAMNELGLNEQEAVNRGCELLVDLHQQFVSKIKALVRSELCRTNPEAELWCHHVFATTVYGLCQASDRMSRSRIDGSSRFYWQDFDHQEMFYNQTDPNNRDKKFEWPLKNIRPDHYKTLDRLI